jgi:hypothetical protein
MSEGESSSNKGLDFSSVAAAAATYQIKLFEIAQANMQLAFEYAQALTAVRSSGEFVSVTSEYAKKRMDMFNKHTKELANSYLPNFVVRQNRSKAGSRRRIFANGAKLERHAANGTSQCMSNAAGSLWPEC